MKKIYFVVMVLSILLVANNQIVKAQNSQVDTKTSADILESQDVGNKICPVSGDKIIEETKSTIEYKGKVYNLCCPACIDEFKKDPDKYIEKVNEEFQPQGKEETKQKEMMPESGMPMTGREMPQTNHQH